MAGENTPYNQGKKPPETGENTPDLLIGKLKAFLLSHYKPAINFNPSGANILYKSTQELWLMLQALYPNESLYTPADVATWMNDAGFSFQDMGDFKLEWVLEKQSVL